MEKGKTVTISQKLILGFGLVISIFILFGLLTLYYLPIVSKQTRTIYNHPLIVSNAAVHAIVSITKIHWNMEKLIRSTSPSDIHRFVMAVNEQENQVYIYLDIVKKKILGDGGQKLENQTRILFENWQPIREEIIVLVRRGEKNAATYLSTDRGANHVILLEDKMIELTNYARSKAADFMQKTEKVHWKMTLALIIFLSLGSLASITIAMLILRESRSAQIKLFQSENRYRSLIENQTELVCRVSVNGVFTFVNQPYCDFFNKSKGELLGKKWHPPSVDENLGNIEEKLGTLSPSNPSVVIENRVYSGVGRIHWMQFVNRGVFDGAGNLEEVQSVGRDITESKEFLARINRQNISLRENEEKYRILFQSASDAVFLVDVATMDLLDANEAAVKLYGYGYEELLQMKAVDLSAEVKKTKAVFRKTFPHSIPIRYHRKKGGQVFPVEIKANYFDLNNRKLNISNIRDITERIEGEQQKQTLESQLRQSQKMESVGRLAGGVAHDYNNALSVIMGFTKLVMDKMDRADPFYEDLNEVITAAESAASITRQLLAFAREQPILPTVFDLNGAVENLLKMLRHLIGEDIDLVWSPASISLFIEMDTSQIDQILVNLCINARDAIQGVGRIIIETCSIVFDKAYCEDHPGFVPGEFVMLALGDNGCGIDKALLDNIFEPFFTTKGVEKGTGLGLSMVYGIIKQNNGFINVYSELGKGTSIKIYLPRYLSKSLEKQGEKIGEIPRGDGETILLVEDNPAVLKLTRKSLERLGYKVLIAENSEGAMALTGDCSEKIHLLITDVIMPGMNGRELADCLQSNLPALKIIFMSGYTANIIADHGVLEEGVNFIQKPFSRSELATTVKKILEE
ncbi:MAG: PAS domain S-box protein [Desulfobacteraceae bacterium]|nr:PAS domain S-box protein [Desulfobacteraceae bacterium]